MPRPLASTEAGEPVSFPRSPKADAIEQMILSFSPLKNIVIEHRVAERLLRARAIRMGLRRYLITEEERDLLLKLRREQGILK